MTKLFVMDTISSRLTRLRAHAPGLSRRGLDTLAGNHGSGLVQHLEAKPTKGVTAGKLAGYARALGCSLGWLATGVGREPSARTVRAALLAVGWKPKPVRAGAVA